MIQICGGNAQSLKDEKKKRAIKGVDLPRDAGGLRLGFKNAGECITPITNLWV
jgi:hypothetical protein